MSHSNFATVFTFALGSLAAVAPAGAAAQNRVAPSPAGARVELETLAQSAERELRGNILPFWLARARDEKRGGFYGRIAQDMTVYPDEPRGTLLTNRILWTFSSSYRRFQDPEYLKMAQWALRDLQAHGWDREHGGLFWTVTPDGQPVQSIKHVYDQAFGIYSLAEYYRATQDRSALDRAIELYHLIEAKARDPRHGGYFEAFTRDWKRDDEAGRRLLGGRGVKSQNTHIHVLEAYTNLLRVWPDPALRADLGALLELMLTKVVDPRSHHLILFFNEDWTPVSDEISYGHDIELSWLIVEAATVLGDETALARARTTAVEMAAATLAKGVDADGGIFNEGNPERVTNPNKDWWPQAEGAVGFLNAYAITHEARFLAAAEKTWNFIETKCVDRKNGDWYESMTRDGTPILKNKLSVWKCPYHNSRSCLEITERAEALLASTMQP
jgi:mannobiose 2-epimerase